MLPDATMFWTVIFGLSVILTLIFFRVLITCSMTSFTWAIDLVPVQTKFPEEKTRTADFGSLTLRTSPGNCSGLYSVLGIVFASLVSGTSLPREVVATMFWIFEETFDFAICYLIVLMINLDWFGL